MQAAKTVALGFDIGHSSVKLSVKGSNRIPLSGAAQIFPTVVRNWSPIANEDTARKAEADTVTVNGRKFFIGVTAQRQGQADNFSGQTRDWISTDQHDALILGAWNRSMATLERNRHENDMTNPSKISVVLGLPASYYMEQRGELRRRATGLLQPLVGTDQELAIYIESQSRAPLLSVEFDAYGTPTGRGGENESWGVVEIGQFTTDFTLHDRGQEVDSAASSARGANMMYDRIGAVFKQRGYLNDFENISTALQTGKIKAYGEEVNVAELIEPSIREFTDYIMDEIASRFGERAQRMDGIIVAGGGAHIVGPAVKSRYRNAVVPHNPRFAVAEGYARFGLLTLAA